MESIQAIGALLQYIVCVGLCVYGGLLAIGKIRLNSGLSLQRTSRRRRFSAASFSSRGKSSVRPSCSPSAVLRRLSS